MERDHLMFGITSDDSKKKFHTYLKSCKISSFLDDFVKSEKFQSLLLNHFQEYFKNKGCVNLPSKIQCEQFASSIKSFDKLEQSLENWRTNNWELEKTITVTNKLNILVGKEFQIFSPTWSSSTGYSIYNIKHDGFLILKEDSTVKHKSGYVGESGKIVWNLKATSVGDYEFSFTLGQSWDKNTEKTYINQIHVIYPQ